MNHPLRVAFHMSGRTKSHSFMYFNMSVRALALYRKLLTAFEKLEHLDPEYDQAFTTLEEAAVLPVVLAGMCLEATLYDLGVCIFGEELVEHIDKLDPLAKYYVLASFIDKEPPSPSGVTYQNLQLLVTARNKLIHHKSHPSFGSDDFAQGMAKANKEHKKHLAGISASLRALVLLSLHFDGRIFEELRIIPSFKRKSAWSGLIPIELHPEIEWCIKASKDEAAKTKHCGAAAP